MTGPLPPHYHVVAMSFPLVYAADGDHDPNGMLYTLKAYEPLLKWVQERWEDNDEYLPVLHRRRQLMQIVVDGLPRFEQMRERLHDGDDADHRLLHELGGEEELLHRAERDARDCAPDAHTRAKRQNYRATVDDLVAALDELTRGSVTRLSPHPGVRRDWLRHWELQLDAAESAIAHRLREVDREFECFLQGDEWRGADLTEEHVKRLLLNDHSFDASRFGTGAPPYDRCNPLKPLPLARPLVLRARRGETVQICFENRIRRRLVGMHLQGEGLGGRLSGGGAGRGVQFGDGARVGRNAPSVAAYGQKVLYEWDCLHEGVWPINDLADVRGTQLGTNAHGLFAALVVEEEGARWFDPETGERLDGTQHADGLYVDVVPPAEHELKKDDTTPEPCAEGAEHTCPERTRCRRWREENFVDFHFPGDDVHAPAEDCSFREFTIFFHDEPEVHSGLHLGEGHSTMPLSYRAEPMVNRLPHRMRRHAARTPEEVPAGQTEIDHSAVRIELDDVLGERFWVSRRPDGQYLERVSGEEQHHSSWLFGEPATPVLRSYKGDPARIRLVHAGVKETHVFHLHVHQWRAVAEDTAAPSVWRDGAERGSQLLDSITIGPQVGMTIDPLYGTGSRQHAVGDIIWHCHLYPHFHHGMWGMWRSYDRLVAEGRAYPDGTPCPPLVPLPGRRPERTDPTHPGFPWFVDASFPRKSPPPPAPRQEDVDQAAAAKGVVPRPVIVDGRRKLLEMGHCSDRERDAFAAACRTGGQPGALFVDLDGKARTWNDRAELPERRILSYDVEVTHARVEYNSDGWHDPRGHHYRLKRVQVTPLNGDGTPGETVEHPAPGADPTRPVEPFFPRANHGDIVELRFQNVLPSFPADDFDPPAEPVECGLHVHLVKFDVLSADGSATGWNYLSGASCPQVVGSAPAGEQPRNVSLHRWVVDEEFGPCFFHDHLLANFRQKHGLSAALVAEPQGSRWYLPDQKTVAWSGTQAVVLPDAVPGTAKDAPRTGLPPFREACLNMGDFVPLYRAPGAPLNVPGVLGGDDDPGAMGVNYRCSPLTHRGDDPSEWFSSGRRNPFDEEAEVRAAALRGEEFPEAETGPLEDPTSGLPLKDRRDPDTPVVWTYPGERLRLRLIQGSHEEQHSFSLHGLRWRRDWCDPGSPLVNQQTLGISEAFTVDLNPERGSRYGVGDHLWQFAAMDDLWLGCWGLIRALQPGRSAADRLLPLPLQGPHPIEPKDVREALAASRASRAVPPRPTRSLGCEPAPAPDALGDRPVLRPEGSWDRPVREFVVVARRAEIQYAGRGLTDPWGLVYERAAGCVEEVVCSTTTRKDEDDPCTHHEETRCHRTGNLRAVCVDHTGGPLVLRARRGEWIRVVLINEVLLPDEENPTAEDAGLPDEEDPAEDVCPSAEDGGAEDTAHPGKKDFAVPAGVEETEFLATVQDAARAARKLPLADPYLPEFGPEVSPPRLPIEHLDEQGYPDERLVSPRVSLHPSLLSYDVVSDDGAYVGHNHDGTVAALDVGEGHGGGGHAEAGGVIYRENHGIGHRDPNWREYWWYADEDLAPATCAEGPGQVCYLQDMGDVRNHRHHGLIGALVVEPGDCEPIRETGEGAASCHPQEPDENTCCRAAGGSTPQPHGRTGEHEEEACCREHDPQWHWSGTQVRIQDGSGEPVAQEVVIFLQDGLRHFLYGDVDQPLRDVEPGDDPEDSGQKGINYRSALVTDNRNPLGVEPPTPVFEVEHGNKVWLRLVCGGDKPRNHTFTVHGMSWPAAPWVGDAPRTGAVNGIAAGFAQDIVLEPREPGDHAYRNGMFKWAVSQGMWGILRVCPPSDEDSDPTPPSPTAPPTGTDGRSRQEGDA